MAFVQTFPQTPEQCPAHGAVPLNTPGPFQISIVADDEVKRNPTDPNP